MKKLLTGMFEYRIFKRNETKRNETKRNETKRNETKRTYLCEKIGRRCSYLVAPLSWKGARHRNYTCSFSLNRGVSL